MISAWTSVALLLTSVTSAAFNPTGNTNLVAYWGQNSYGATHTSDTANWQTNLANYCQDDTVDVFPLAFLDVFFGIGSLPEINFANICNDVDDAVFPGSDLANCQFMATDIQTCQAAGKIITLSMGGATGADTFTSESQAEDFADLIWDLFLGGTSSTRPFGDAVLDGIDLDIEGGGTANFAAFVTRIRTLAEGASKAYYITGAPQCPFPDANLDTVLNAVGFDAVYVQFYNNYCEVSNYNVAGDWDFSSWDNWAKTTSPNPDVKIYIGAPASSTAATNGYADASALSTILQATKATYSSFGGAMLWDISQAYGWNLANGRFDQAVKTALLGGSSAPTTSGGSTTTTKTTTTSSSSATSTTSVATNGDCAGVAAWVSTVAYVGGSQVTYNGHLWTANYWSEADVPGGASGDWADDGVCTTDATLIPAVASDTSSLSAASITAHVSSTASAGSVSVQAASSAAAPTVSVSSAVSTTSSFKTNASTAPTVSVSSVDASVTSGSAKSVISAASTDSEILSATTSARRSRFFKF
ncbi:glycoside hydrolase superfamily [Lentinula lateritia]|uniref:chitinase n=1 Tax=Lentinula lateritia TaxID=40482 RepID=A0ABQ8VE09_9AGAR|nr:glycoside hydrolase superfamily [Lentinula lateritia]